MIRQGDILFVPMRVSELESCHVERLPDGVIAKGEATGHHHRIEDLRKAEVLHVGWNGSKAVRVGPEGVRILHEEHGPVVLGANTLYRIHQAREFDYLQGLGRRVRD